MMTTIAFMIGGGVCKRSPDLRMVFLEAHGGWIVPWLERLDHHRDEFGFDVPWLDEAPSETFRRQCWISFDPDESTLAFTAQSPLVGADRMVWASDYPHPDAKFPGTTKELSEVQWPPARRMAELFRLTASFGSSVTSPSTSSSNISSSVSGNGIGKVAECVSIVRLANSDALELAQPSAPPPIRISGQSR